MIFYVVLLVAQGFLSAAMAPLPAPDLFLIAMLTLLPRLNAWQLVLAGFGIGLVQDLTGHGILGLHAIGLAAAALVASFMRAQLSQSGMAERLLTVIAALLGKWLAMAAMVVWLAGDWSALAALPFNMLFDSVFTLVVGTWLLSLSENLQSRGRTPAREGQW